MTIVVRSIVRTDDVERAALPDLQAVRAARVAALVSRRDASPRPTEEELREHDAITRLVHDTVASLPSRFGDAFPSEDSLASALRAREDVLVTNLDRIGDRVELDVTLRWRDRRREDDVRPSTGREYLEARRVREHERREAEQLVARLIEQLPCERAFIRHRICPRPDVAAIVAILSTRDGAAALKEHIDSFAQRARAIVTVVHGPLPPFEFVS